MPGEIPLDEPGDPVTKEDLCRAKLLSELPVREVSVVTPLELVGRSEVVFGLGRVPDLALDAGQAKDPNSVPFVGKADQVELTATKYQVVRIDSP